MTSLSDDTDAASPVAGGVLVLNAGSSSLKYALVDSGSGARRAYGAVTSINHVGGSLHHHVAGDAEPVTVAAATGSHAEAIGMVFDAFDRHGPALDDLIGVGHRVVHGGARFTGPALVDDDVRAAIAELVPLAPLHNRLSLDCIDKVAEVAPRTPQVAVFDTAFHSTIPEHASRFAIATQLADRWQLRRYGFHGTSVDYVTSRAAALLGRDHARTSVIVCHLGNGASVSAVRNGRSVENSMGFSPLGGLMMGTRSGDFDASAVLYLLDQAGMDVRDVESLLNERSGLRGVAGDSDMIAVRGLADAGDPAATLSLEMYAYRVRFHIGASLAALPALHALVFTGGIGEHDQRLRAAVCGPLEHLGIALDPHANDAANGNDAVDIGAGRVPILVIPTDEEQQIARHTIELVTQSPRRA